MALAQLRRSLRGVLLDEGVALELRDIIAAAIPFVDADYIIKRWDGEGVCVVYRAEVLKLRAALESLALSVSAGKK